jgi:hypothetical protein
LGVQSAAGNRSYDFAGAPVAHEQDTRDHPFRYDGARCDFTREREREPDLHGRDARVQG